MRSEISRRNLLVASAAAGAAALLKPAEAVLKPLDPLAAARFRIVHMTDLHIQPELGATEGVALAVKKVLSLRRRPDFILTGGDHVMDVMFHDRARADVEFGLLAEALKPLEMPIHVTPGNHDVFGWGIKGFDKTSPGYGKKMFEERVAKGPCYRSFDHKGWHFVILDTIGAASDKDWRAVVDDTQLTWLKSDLERASGKPTVILTHVPLVTAFMQFTSKSTDATPEGLITLNGREVADLCAKFNVKAVLQGHTHIRENVEYLGTQYITGGAVSGDWWKGPRLGVHPEGFMVFDIDGDKITGEYVTYGWQARK